MDHLTPHPELYDLPFTLNEFNGMPYRLLGSSGLRVSNVGLGTWKIGYPETGDGSRVNKETALKMFDRAIELGITFWDTANRYGNSSGNSERIIGLWLNSNPDQRRNIVLATKLYGSMDGKTPNHCRLSRINILESVYASLERLQVDCVDLLYFHSFDSDTPIAESLEAVEDLVGQDLVRYLAVSNFNLDQMKMYYELQQYFSRRCAIQAVQNQFDILKGEQLSGPGVLEFVAKHNISFIAWGPLARGLLTERYLDISKAGKGDRLVDEGTLEKDRTKEVVKKIDTLVDLAQNWDMKLNQLVLAYMLTLPGMGAVIPSASNVKQLESNGAAGKIDLSSEQINKIKAVVGSK
jgi:aryl-alcohol dehydrogenase-like predicted oxidoreductase